jgi:hypothetical protein
MYSSIVTTARDLLAVCKIPAMSGITPDRWLSLHRQSDSGAQRACYTFGKPDLISDAPWNERASERAGYW